MREVEDWWRRCDIDIEVVVEFAAARVVDEVDLAMQRSVGCRSDRVSMLAGIIECCLLLMKKDNGLWREEEKVGQLGLSVLSSHLSSSRIIVECLSG